MAEPLSENMKLHHKNRLEDSIKITKSFLWIEKKKKSNY